MTDTPDFTALPPRPDPSTGEPFPPHGRAWRGQDRAPENNRNRETRLSHKPTPPAGKGPVLAWHKENRRGKVMMFLGSAVFFVVGLTFIRAIAGDQNPISWTLLWQPWIVVVIGSLLIARPLSYLGISAGADWVQCQVVRFGVTIRKKRVDLYRLRSINVTTGPAALYLALADDSSSIDLARPYWQADRRIWDLVYNGILHSTAAGAETNQNARGFLELEHVQEFHHQDGARQIDVTKLSDVHVWELMEDPVVRSMCDSIQFQGGAAEFRELFPELNEKMLSKPANPKWFTTNVDTNTGNTKDKEEP